VAFEKKYSNEEKGPLIFTTRQSYYSPILHILHCPEVTQQSGLDNAT